MNKPDGAPAMSKSKILAELDDMVFARLFGRGPWLADRESCVALQTKIEQMGLEERCPGERETWRSTSLGKELHSDLVMVFLGLLMPAELHTHPTRGGCINCPAWGPRPCQVPRC